MFANIFDFSSPHVVNFSKTEIFILFFQQTTVYSAFILLVTFLITVLLVKLNVNAKKFSVLFSLIKYINMLFVGLILFCVFFKFVLYL